MPLRAVPTLPHKTKEELTHSVAALVVRQATMEDDMRMRWMQTVFGALKYLPQFGAYAHDMRSTNFRSGMTTYLHAPLRVVANTSTSFGSSWKHRALHR